MKRTQKNHSIKKATSYKPKPAEAHPSKRWVPGTLNAAKNALRRVDSRKYLTSLSENGEEVYRPHYEE